MFQVGSNVENPIILFKGQGKNNQIFGISFFPALKGAKMPKISYSNHNSYSKLEPLITKGLAAIILIF